MLTRIILIRHGRSAHGLGSSWVDADGLQRWRTAYDAAGIAVEDAPPALVANAVGACDLIVSSDLRRAVESAARLAPGRPVAESALLRESALPIPNVPIRLPVTAWGALATIGWGYRIMRRAFASPSELQRAARAAEWFCTLAPDAATVAVITHGVFRRLLANHLQSDGWLAVAEARNYKNWSMWSVERR